MDNLINYQNVINSVFYKCEKVHLKECYYCIKTIKYIIK